jgi:hypothetical protein
MTTTTTTTTTQPQLLTVLSLLDTYAAVHGSGNTAWKKSQWNLYKARHYKSSACGLLAASDGLKATDVREELRARAVLRQENAVEPKLVDDQVDDDDKGKDSLAAPRFVLVDAVEQKQEQEKENAATTATSSSTTQDASAPGLRNRKTSQKKPMQEDSKKEWKQDDDEQDDEDRLWQEADPLLLFGGGLSPRELLTAQTQAKEALARYVEAANLIAAIQHELRPAKK